MMTQKFVRATTLLMLLGVPIACDSGTDPVVPASIDVTSEVDVLPAGQTVQLLADVRDESDAPIPNADVDFTSSNTAVATVGEAGLVTGVGEGEVQITGTAGAHSDAVTIFIFQADDLCLTGLRLLPSEPVRASLQEGDCEYDEDGTFLDLWFFELAQETSITVDMTSDDLDSFMWLFDDFGEELAQDDNSGDGPNARIQITIPAGTYWVVANHWPSQSGAVLPGTYTITLTTGTTAILAPEAISMDTRTRTFEAGASPGKK